MKAELVDDRAGMAVMPVLPTTTTGAAAAPAEAMSSDAFPEGPEARAVKGKLQPTAPSEAAIAAHLRQGRTPTVSKLVPSVRDRARICATQ